MRCPARAAGPRARLRHRARPRPRPRCRLRARAARPARPGPDVGRRPASRGSRRDLDAQTEAATVDVAGHELTAARRDTFRETGQAVAATVHRTDAIVTD